MGERPEGVPEDFGFKLVAQMFAIQQRLVSHFLRVIQSIDALSNPEIFLKAALSNAFKNISVL